LGGEEVGEEVWVLWEEGRVRGALLSHSWREDNK